jgi:xanthine dehydrogenase accessory factor
MKQLKHHVILIKGAGEKASAVAYRLHRCGFARLVMTDIPFPAAERRAVSFCEALIDGRKEIGGVAASRAEPDPDSVREIWQEGRIAVIPDPSLEILQGLRPDILIDAVMAKKNTGTATAMAPLVIGLGPGLTAGGDVHLVVETNPDSNDLGALIDTGPCEGDTGIPPSVMNFAEERILRAPAEGILTGGKSIGERVDEGDVIARVGDIPLRSGVSGVLWGLVRDGVSVKEGRKIGDIDPRGNPRYCHEITPHARAVAGGVLEAILRYYNTMTDR